MLKALLVAAFVSLIIGVINDGWEVGWIDGSSIFFAVFIITSVTAGNNFAKEKQFQKLQAREKQGQTIPIYRNGILVTKFTTEIVVGDIIKLEKGKEIPADCILISGNNMTCNESSETGETLDLVKRPLEQCSEK
jgi:Ca2+ transporting ATPase